MRAMIFIFHARSTGIKLAFSEPLDCVVKRLRTDQNAGGVQHIDIEAADIRYLFSFLGPFYKLAGADSQIKVEETNHE